eukprot:scaffold189897_cov40-Prasinocladus_malaysianus.AAC.2
MAELLNHLLSINPSRHRAAIPKPKVVRLYGRGHDALTVDSIPFYPTPLHFPHFGPGRPLVA